FPELSSFVPELRETRQQRPKMVPSGRVHQPKVSQPLRDMKELDTRVNKAAISKEAAFVQSMSSHRKRANGRDQTRKTPPELFLGSFFPLSRSLRCCNTLLSLVQYS
ncbi:uncharacterized, partial [Tachysurus ichikawai]